MKRWHSIAYYRTSAGILRAEEFECEELGELEDFIEAGPSWLTLERIVTTYVGLPDKLTLEEAEEL